MQVLNGKQILKKLKVIKFLQEEMGSQKFVSLKDVVLVLNLFPKKEHSV